MKKLFFAALVFAVIAVMIAACSDNDSDTTGAIDYRKAAEREYKKLLDAWFYQRDEHTLMWYQVNALDTLIYVMDSGRRNFKAEW